MERVQVLIDKLVQQQQQKESAAQMLLTVQLLQNELLQLNKKNTSFSTSKVAVVMPASNFAVPEEKITATTVTPDVVTPVEEIAPVKEAEKIVETIKEPEPAPIPEIVQAPAPEKAEPIQVVQPQPEPVKEAEVPPPAAPQKDLFGNEIYTLRRPSITLREEEPETKPEVKPAPQPVAAVKPPEPEPHPFDAIAETPTLMQHIPPPAPELPVKEIHQLISQEQPSLNDRLKQEKTELAHKLKDTPVKDLRKAIGINDKFLFVSELFRGDEAMYERSIKTINGFHILQEAEYWMNRELKVKLGWNDNKDTVQHFYQLVRRRFS